jgi:uncharacterized protein YndB with AHSA1/START domain
MTMQDTFVVDRQKLEVVQSRVFDAPRARVWKAITDPAIIPHWWGPRALTTTVDKLDLKVGGDWRFLQYDAQGNQYAFHGKYMEIHAPERLVYSFIFEPYPEQVVIATVTLEELPGERTKLTDVSRYSKLEDLDGMVEAGMESGAREGFERLAEVLEGMKERG